MMGRPMDNAAIRYMFTSFLRGELQLDNLVMGVSPSTKQFMIKKSMPLRTILYGLGFMWIGGGSWEYVFRLIPEGDAFVDQVYFTNDLVRFLHTLNRYGEYVE